MMPNKKNEEMKPIAGLPAMGQEVLKTLSTWGPLALIPAFVGLLLVFFLFRGDVAILLFNLLFGFEKQYDFFYQTLGMNDAWSTVLARVMQFVTALGWVPLLVYLPRRGLDPRNIAIVFLGFAAIYIANPLIKAMAGSDVCFDQKTGQPIKWYVIENTGKITLYDSDGFDRAGVRKRLATTDICRTYYAQRHGIVPHRLNGNPHTMSFFDANGMSKIWYSRDADNQYRLFDAPGFDPNTGVRLEQVTAQVRDDIVAAYDRTQAEVRPPPPAAPARSNPVRHRKPHSRGKVRMMDDSASP
jgi:hypothetical protein